MIVSNPKKKKTPAATASEGTKTKAGMTKETSVSTLSTSVSQATLTSNVEA